MTLVRMKFTLDVSPFSHQHVTKFVARAVGDVCKSRDNRNISCLHDSRHMLLACLLLACLATLAGQIQCCVGHVS